MLRTSTLLFTALASALPLLITGCAGTSSALLVSSTNVGVDIDSKPPQAEISISRKELAVQPGFEGGKTLPAVMSFSTKGSGNMLSKFFFGISSVFSTGRAATALVGGVPGADDDEGDEIEVDEPPVAHRISDEVKGKHRELIGPGQMRPLVFGTRTIFGLHAAWDGSNVAPSDLKIGFNRKEAAYAPIGYARNTRRNPKRPYIVQVPSTLATIDNGTATGTSGKLENYHSQYFATGRAAEALARKPAIQRLLLERIEPAVAAEEGFAGESATRPRLNAWLKGPERKARIQTVRAWIEAQGGKYDWDDLVSLARLENQRIAFLSAHSEIP